MDPNKLAVKFGLVDNESQSLIPLRSIGNNSFATTRPLSVGQKFKVAVTNSVESYIYVFGKESDGPLRAVSYTEKTFWVYCGISGYKGFSQKTFP
ncbi:MAG: hypothetical protein R2769_11435 [Saprospiraceae bacterium]